MTDQDDGALVKRDGALAGAAVSAAIGVAVYGLRKLLAEGSSGGLSLGQRGAHDADVERAGHLLVRNDSLLETAWDSASRALVPLAESAAEAAGKWVAQNSPDLVRERLMPRFIESFTDAA
jgi:hypothetical protein